MRLQRNTNNAVKRFIDSKDTDITIDFYPPYSSLKELRDRGVKINKRTPIRVRMVKVLLDTGETEVLITNLYDTSLYTTEELKEVYHLRWGIETFYGYVKEEGQKIKAYFHRHDFLNNLYLLFLPK